MITENNYNNEQETIIPAVEPTLETVHASGTEPSDTIKPIGLAIASMVCGILSVLCCFKIIKLILAIIAVIFGGVALKKRHRGRGMAIAGLICGLLALILFVILILYGAAVGSALLYELS